MCSGSYNSDSSKYSKNTYAICLSRPHAMLLNVPVKQVACGAEHSLLLSAAGNAVYACGRGEYGQLGNVYNTKVSKKECNSVNKQ